VTLGFSRERAGRGAADHDAVAATARARGRAVLLLAALSGATDAIGLIALGGAFTSVMTGNLVLVGVAAGTADASALGLTAAAIGGYMAGVYVGARAAGEPQPGQGPWPHRVNRALFVELAALALFAAAWWSLGSGPASGWFAPLIAVNALALGVQSSAILRFGVSGLSTTYMTGTLTSMITRLAARHPLTSVRTSGALLAALIAGAGAAGLLVSVAPAGVPALQLVLIGAVVAVGVRRGSPDEL
jgi:uncharacterized membrane protein YoaK (UPF0700 family)